MRTDGGNSKPKTSLMLMQILHAKITVEGYNL